MKTSILVAKLLVVFCSVAVSQTVPGLYTGAPFKLMFEYKKTDPNTFKFYDAASNEMLLMIMTTAWKTKDVFLNESDYEIGEDYANIDPAYNISFEKGYAKIILYADEKEISVARMRLSDLTVEFTDEQVKCLIFPLGNRRKKEYGWSLKVNKTIVGIAVKTDPVDIFMMLAHVVQSALKEDGR